MVVRGLEERPVITLQEIREVFTDDGGVLALAFHESIWEGIQEDLAQGSTTNQVKPLLEELGVRKIR